MDAIILMDCWKDFEPITPNREKMFCNIVDSIQQIDPALVVLSTNSSRELFDRELQQNSKWYSTFFEYFPEYQDIECGNPVYKTSDILLQLDLNCIQIALTHQWQLDHVLAQNKMIPDRVWFFGLYWNSCVRDNNLGWHHLRWYFKLKHNKTIDIMFRESCSLKHDETFPEIEYDQMINAENIGDDTWKLLHETGAIFGKV